MDTLAVIAFQASAYTPAPRFADTVELSLLDLLTVEAQADHDEAQLAAVREWLKEGGN